VLGSILAQAYRSQLSPHLAALTPAARSAATGSITATQTVASELGTAGVRLDGFADTAFVHAMHVTTMVSAAITLVGALVVLIWMPGRTADTEPVAVVTQPRADSAELVKAELVEAEFVESDAGVSAAAEG
jgi:DHA2 family integral membrane protein (MFS transporter)